MISFIWNVLVKARRENVDLNMIEFAVSNDISPYMELNNSNINMIKLKTNEKNVFEVNPYLRFFDIFSELNDINYTEDDELKPAFIDVLFHFLGQIDLNDGMTAYEYYLLFLEREIRRGLFGKKVSQNIDLFSIDEKRVYLDNVISLYMLGSTFANYKKAVREIFPGSVLYDYTRSEDELVLYIPKKKNDNNLKKYELVTEVFLPFGLEVSTYWEFHFGIVDINPTMIIGEMSIFESGSNKLKIS